MHAHNNTRVAVLADATGHYGHECVLKAVDMYDIAPLT